MSNTTIARSSLNKTVACSFYQHDILYLMKNFSLNVVDFEIVPKDIKFATRQFYLYMYVTKISRRDNISKNVFAKILYSIAWKILRAVTPSQQILRFKPWMVKKDSYVESMFQLIINCTYFQKYYTYKDHILSK